MAFRLVIITCFRVLLSSVTPYDATVLIALERTSPDEGPPHDEIVPTVHLLNAAVVCRLRSDTHRNKQLRHHQTDDSKVDIVNSTVLQLAGLMRNAPTPNTATNLVSSCSDLVTTRHFRPSYELR